jgi:hypothetical protein
MDEKRRHPPSISKLSKTPSWVMLGFILGVLVVLLWPRRQEAPRPIVVTAAPPTVVAPRSTLTTVEAVFAQWLDYAVWDNDVTQIVVWNPALNSFSDGFEVRRIDGAYYFRSISQITNRVIRHGKQPPPECPLRFTETEEQYREWRNEGRFERPPEETRTMAAPALSSEVAKPKPTAGDVRLEPPAPDGMENKPELPPRK